MEIRCTKPFHDCIIQMEAMRIDICVTGFLAFAFSVYLFYNYSAVKWIEEISRFRKS